MAKNRLTLVSSSTIAVTAETGARKRRTKAEMAKLRSGVSVDTLPVTVIAEVSEPIEAPVAKRKRRTKAEMLLAQQTEVTPEVVVEVPVEAPAKRKRRTKAEMALAVSEPKEKSEPDVIRTTLPEISTVVEAPVKRKRRTKAEMTAAKEVVISEPEEVIEPVIEEVEPVSEPVAEVTAKRKRRTKAEMNAIMEPVAPVVIEAPVTEDLDSIAKFVIGYADAYRTNQYKDIETHSKLTKDQFIESAKQIYRETPDVKYVYVECYFNDGDIKTCVIYKNPKSDVMSINRLWAA